MLMRIPHSIPSVLGIAPRRRGVAAEAIQGAGEQFARRELRHPTICEAPGSLEHLLDEVAEERAHPDRDRPLHRQWVDADAIEMVPVAVERDEFVRPQLAHDGDLFLDASAPVREVLVERLVLHPVAADAHTEPQPTSGQQIEFGGLLGQQHRLALRADDDRCRQLQASGDRTEEGEQHERLVARNVEGVDLLAGSLAIGVSADHVVVGQHAVETGALHRLGHVLQERRIVADVARDQYRPELHGCRNVAKLSVARVLSAASRAEKLVDAVDATHAESTRAPAGRRSAAPPRCPG